MRTTSLSLLAAAALAVTAAPAAQADTLVTKAPAGSTNLAFGGGHLAWAQPEGDAFRLVVRKPDGTITTPAIPAFETAPDPAIGTIYGADFKKTLYAVFSRDGDIKKLDLATGVESAVKGAATSAYRESAPSLNEGTLAFVRRGGARNGVHVLSTRKGTVKRISATMARETATNGTRVAYTVSSGLRIVRISGEGRALRVGGDDLRSIVLTRYQAAWVTGDGTLQRTDRFAGSGGPYTLQVRDTARQPEGLVSIAVGETFNQNRYLDAEGVKAGDQTLLR
jgi:opacity protein-like surface antigen